MTTPHGASTRTRPGPCGFCGYEVTGTPVRTESGVRCCSDRCREAFEAGETPFAGRNDFKRFTTGVSALDSLLPEGVPATSFVVLAGTDGIRHRGIQTELLWRTLLRGEPAIVITYVDPPVAVVEHFLTFGWNVLPFLESGHLRIVDCFTSRLRQKHQVPTHQTGWNEFLGTFLEAAVTIVRETGNLESVEDTLHGQLERMEMTANGIVVVDSLNEVDRQGHESETEQFVKEVRGDVCSRRFVPLITSLTRPENGQFGREYAYLFDGIVKTRHDESYADGVRLKQLSIQKMDGVLHIPRWVTYESTGQSGYQLFDPDDLVSSVYGIPSMASRANTGDVADSRLRYSR